MSIGLQAQPYIPNTIGLQVATHNEGWASESRPRIVEEAPGFDRKHSLQFPNHAFNDLFGPETSNIGCLDPVGCHKAYRADAI